jgi:multiple sugar transport system ATP-binding protein
VAEVLFQHVTKQFGSVVVLQDLDLAVRDREFLVLVGPSGCGKSTAMRLVAGLEDVSAGAIVIGGRVVNDLPPRDRDVAMVFQSYALYPHMSVYDNLAYALRLRHFNKDETDRRVRDAARSLGIEALLRRKPRELSGGQRQRVALGRAIVREAQVFLMDEPLSNLDAQLRVQTRAELIRLHERLAATVIYVTHDQVEAMTMGDRLAVLNAGVLQQLDTPQAIYDRPSNLFVARFIGSPEMNVLPARLERADGSLNAVVLGQRLRMTREQAAAAESAADANVLIGIRPEHLRLVEGASPPAGATLGGRVEVVERLGNELFVYLDASGTTLIARVPADSPVSRGEIVQLAVDRQRMHLFDVETERALTPDGQP